MPSESDLWAEIVSKFNKSATKNARLVKLQKMISDGSYKLAYDYAKEIGLEMSKALTAVLEANVAAEEVMERTVANATVGKGLTTAGEKINQIAEKCQAAINQAAKVSIKPIQTAVDTDRITGLVDRLTGGAFQDVKWLLDDPVRNFCLHTVDQNVQKNADFLADTGLETTVERSYNGGTLDGGRTCEFCADLAGVYHYPFDGKIFARHENCTCEIETSLSGKMRTSGRAFVRS